MAAPSHSTAGCGVTQNRDWSLTMPRISPTIRAVLPLTASTLDVSFSESVAQAAAENPAHYSVTNGIGNPFSAVRDATDKSLVTAVSDVLHISEDSSYRRIRGETPLVLDELKERLRGRRIFGRLSKQCRAGARQFCRRLIHPEKPLLDQMGIKL